MRPELTGNHLPRAVAGLLVLASAIVTMRCAPETKCGAGTVERDGACVPENPIVTCGTGTVAQGNTCVPVREEPVDAGSPPACDPACGAGEVCDASGICVPSPVPGAWACGPARYRDGLVCDCDCGAVDPDCVIAEAPVQGCTSGACRADGTCEPCTRNCSGRACGPDGCGGTCGDCFDPMKLYCIDGACAACTPDCEGKTCGPDGCGGECGTCGALQVCTLGSCGAPPVDASCSGRCRATAPSGCSCQGGCDRLGTCCADVELCGCLPSCGLRKCGDDGCGGVCGSCAVGELCVGGDCVANPCQPDPCLGNGTCHLPFGTCTCATGYAGDDCSRCAIGYTGYPNCAL